MKLAILKSRQMGKSNIVSKVFYDHLKIMKRKSKIRNIVCKIGGEI